MGYGATKFRVCVMLMILVGGFAAYAQTLAELVKASRASIVKLSVKNALGIESAAASGFFMANDRVVTNHHVVEDASAITVQLNDSSIFKVKQIMAVDTVTDLALLLVDVPADYKVTICSIEEALPEVGENVFVISHPLGMEQTVSNGIISGVRMSEKPDKRIQFTAPISQGSSGGALMNMKGRVIGIVTATITAGQGLNLASASSSLFPLNTGSPLPWAEPEKSYGNERMKILDAFSVKGFTTLDKQVYEKTIEQNMASLSRAAFRKGWDSTVVYGQKSRMTRLCKRYAEKDIEKDVLTAAEAALIINESVGSNTRPRVVSEEVAEQEAYLTYGLSIASSMVTMSGEVTKVLEVVHPITTTHQETVELEEGKVYVFITATDKDCIKDIDAVLFKWSEDKWVPVASDTDDDNAPILYYEPKESGEYVVVWRVARLWNTCTSGAFGTMVLANTSSTR